MGSSKELSKENKSTTSLRTFMSVFRPIRDWLHSRPKTSTPISNPILRSSSANGHIQRHHPIDAALNQNRMHDNNNINTIHNSSNNNSYGGDSLTGSSGDMLSTVAPTPIHNLHHHSTFQQRFTPTTNGHGGANGLMNTMDELNGTSGFSVREGAESSVAGANGMGSNLDLSQQFSRSAQARMSLPIMQQNKMRRQAYSQLQRRGQQVARSLGHIYLQHKGETKQASLPNELTTIDTIRALFVCAFPHLLTMEYMCQPYVKIYIYNPSCNIFYELCDIEDVRHESVLRIHHSDSLAPLALPSQLSMVSMNGVPAAAALAHNPYSTLHRLPPRIPPQPQSQQQISKQQNPPMQTQIHSQQGNLSQQTLLQQHHVMQSMAMPMGTPHLQYISPQISQIPPPKPRRMIAASYSIHRINPTQ